MLTRNRKVIKMTAFARRKVTAPKTVAECIFRLTHSCDERTLGERLVAIKKVKLYRDDDVDPRRFNRMPEGCVIADCCREKCILRGARPCCKFWRGTGLVFTLLLCDEDDASLPFPLNLGMILADIGRGHKC